MRKTVEMGKSDGKIARTDREEVGKGLWGSEQKANRFRSVFAV
jgi:hypothetical protein